MAEVEVQYDVLIVGGGPAGLSAALALGRARKRVLVCDAGPRRNAAATHLHNFVTQDGTPPEAFRRQARAQLAAYPQVEVRDLGVVAVSGERGAFQVVLPTQTVEARRILLCTGMVDEPLPIEGYAALWGRSIFQCPYCHGWEAQDRTWGFFPRGADAHLMAFALQARGWTRSVVVFTRGAFEVPPSDRAQLEAAGIGVVTAPVERLVEGPAGLEAVVLATGALVPCDVIFSHPPQRQVELVTRLGLAFDAEGFVQVDPMRRETSRPGIYAAGDLTSRMQAAIAAAAAGVQAAAAINVELTLDLVAQGALE